MEASSTSKPKLGFMLLPREVRDEIYHYVLLPVIEPQDVFQDHLKHAQVLGCSHVFPLSRTIYTEASEILDTISGPYIYLFGTGRSIFRFTQRLFRPLYPQPFRTSQSPTLPEVAFVGLRKVTVCIRTTMPVFDVLELCNAIKKSQNLQSITLKLQFRARPAVPRHSQRNPDWEVQPDLTDADPICEEIYPLVDLAIEQNINLYIEDDQHFVGNQLVYIHTKTAPPPVSYYLRYRQIVNEFDRELREWSIPPKLDHWHNDRVLTPECRRCWELFRSEDQLKAHLIGKPCKIG